ncbi:MAG: adenylate/guanylate cyclase domain-containing protein [Chloroflexaceae bacterium]|nr:adenylate/guanylate cyclase domain-containing protein [Chloroflexaceae bacterium]
MAMLFLTKQPQQEDSMGISEVLAQLLQEYLQPEQVVQCLQDGDVPANLRVTLAHELRRSLSASAAYIPSRLVRAQLIEPVPGRIRGAFWQGSLLFADLSGFTALSQTLSVLGKQGSEEVSAIINQLFDALVAQVTLYQGMLLKFGGDALTAFFDTETLGPGHAAAATCAALAMQRCMVDMFATLETRAGTFRLGLRVGVHSGKVFAAEVGDLSHIELVITGAEVNRVAMAQEIAAPGEVVITTQTADLLQQPQLELREDGFWHITSLPDPDLPNPAPDPMLLHRETDLATLERLALRVMALRPYLVRGLPRRFFLSSVTEIGEFRPVTVLFVNFYNFSYLLELVGDAPDLAALVLNAYYQRAQTVVHRYDGIVNKVDMYTHGDKLMILFGAPSAHEDDPLRSVHCALELKSMVTEANVEIVSLLGYSWTSAVDPTDSGYRPPLLQRSGINTGAVFAGRVGGAQRYEYTVMGPAVNLSARLMSAAQDGMVLLSPDTRIAVEHQIVVEQHEPLKLKGLTELVLPACALQVMDEMSTASPSTRTGGDRADTDRLEPALLVGRETEFDRLVAEGIDALRGSGRVLALIGEAGIGKTRLSEEVTTRLFEATLGLDDDEALPHFFIYSSECQSYEQITPYFATRAPLHHLLRLNRLSPRTLQQATSLVSEIEERVNQLSPHMLRFAPLLTDILGIPWDETPAHQFIKHGPTPRPSARIDC